VEFLFEFLLELLIIDSALVDSWLSLFSKKVVELPSEDDDLPNEGLLGPLLSSGE